MSGHPVFVIMQSNHLQLPGTCTTDNDIIFIQDISVFETTTFCVLNNTCNHYKFLDIILDIIGSTYVCHDSDVYVSISE